MNAIISIHFSVYGDFLSGRVCMTMEYLRSAENTESGDVLVGSPCNWVSSHLLPDPLSNAYFLQCSPQAARLEFSIISYLILLIGFEVFELSSVPLVVNGCECHVLLPLCLMIRPPFVFQWQYKTPHLAHLIRWRFVAVPRRKCLILVQESPPVNSSRY
uniref:ZP domain-containing protein n=1 Tax=Heterorhabditis bacteriophora TaxID=37862 RepID=A0A1I7XET4_HETBA